MTSPYYYRRQESEEAAGMDADSCPTSTPGVQLEPAGPPDGLTAAEVLLYLPTAVALSAPKSPVIENKVFVWGAKAVIKVVNDEWVGGGDPFAEGGVYETAGAAAISELWRLRGRCRSDFDALSISLDGILSYLHEESMKVQWSTNKVEELEGSGTTAAAEDVGDDKDFLVEDDMSDYCESDAEAVDDEDAEDAAGFTFFVTMADPSSCHESDNADAGVTDDSTHGDGETISDYGAEFDVGRTDGMGEIIPDDDGDDLNAQPSEPSSDKRGGLVVFESAVAGNEDMSAYCESDAETVDCKDAEDAAGFTFFMSMADPSSAHESDNADAEVKDGSTDSELSDEGAISDYFGAEFDVGRLDGLSELTPDDDGADLNDQARDPSIDNRGGLAVLESAGGEKEGMNEYRRSDAEVVGESGDETASTYDEFDAKVMDDEDVEDAADVTLFMSMTDKNSGRESDNADAEVKDGSTHSVISDEEPISDYGAQCGVGRMDDLDGFVPGSDGEDSNAQPTGPFVDKRGGSAVLESAVVEIEAGLALEMPFLPAKEPAEDGDSDSSKTKEEEEGDTAVRVQPDTTKGHTGRCPVEMRRWPESVPTLSVVSPRRNFVQDTIINTNARAGNTDCGQTAVEQVGVPASLVVAQLTIRTTTPALLVKPVTEKTKKGGVYGECCPVAACRQVNVPALVVLPTRCSRKRFLLGGVAGDIARAVHSDHSPEITFRSVNAPALVAVPPKARSDRTFLQERVDVKRAPAGYRNNCPALAGRVNEPALLVKPEKRSGRYCENEGSLGTKQQAASRDRPPVLVSRQVNRPAVLVVPLESRSKRLVLHGGMVVRGVGAMHRDCYYPTVLTQRNAPVVRAVPLSMSSERRFSKGGTDIVEEKARVVHSDRPPVVVSQHVNIMPELLTVQPPRLSERHVGVVVEKARAVHRGHCPVLLQRVHMAVLARPPVRCLERGYGRWGYN